MYGHLDVLGFILYLIFTVSLYDGKNMRFHVRVVRSIARPIHGIARQMGDSNLEEILGSRHLQV